MRIVSWSAGIMKLLSVSYSVLVKLVIGSKLMYTHSSGRGLFGFGDMANFQKRPNFPMVIKKFNCLELAQKNHACRGQCHVHVHQFWWVWSL